MLLIDAAAWRERRLTPTIEALLGEYIASGGRLWKNGVSQPPFVLALGNEYLRLDPLWNVRGLGRHEMTRTEHRRMVATAAARFNRSAAAYNASGVVHRRRNGALAPYVQLFADHARVLHFNGRLKPWSGAPHASDDEPALCAVDATRLQPCSARWWMAFTHD